jgi:lipoprotein-releasing system permease protein
VLTSQSHISLQPPDEAARPLRSGPAFELSRVQMPLQRIRSVDQWQKALRILREDGSVLAASPVAAGAAIATRGEARRSITVMGIEPNSFFEIVPLPANLVAGTPRLTSQDIVIGTELARYLGVSVGDRVVVSGVSGRKLSLTVTGIFDLGNRAVNERNAYVALRIGQSMADLLGGVSSIEVSVRDVYAAEELGRQFQALTRSTAYSWIATNAQFFAALRAQIITNTAVRLFVGLSVALGIASVLVISVIQRSRDIGILRAMGTSRAQILRVFLLQGALIGLAGAALGAAAGVGALLFWHDHVRQADGTELVPLIIEGRMLLLTGIVAPLIGLLAAMAPALRAARLDPVVAIHG